MLGLQTPISRPPLPKRWLDPYQSALSCQDRIGKVETALKKEVESVLGECADHEMGLGLDEVLGKAVGEVIRLGEGAKD